MKKTTGNVLSVGEGIVVHGCNAQGVMGSGIAQQIRSLYPDVYEDYREYYEKKGLKVGDVVFSPPRLSRPFWVANAITQEYYGRDTQKVYVDYNGLKKCFEQVADFAQDQGLSVYFPQVGAGLANGDWEKIEGIIEEALGSVDRTLFIFQPPRFQR